MRVLLVRCLSPVDYAVVRVDKLPGNSVILHDRKYRDAGGQVLEVYATSMARQQVAQLALHQAKDPVWKDDPSYGWNRSQGRQRRR